MCTRKNIDIQCLRAIAIILVIMQHYKGRLPTTQAYVAMFSSISLWTGVDIFFAISGLLIFKSINVELAASENKTIAAKTFFAKRLRRLYPALLLALFVSVLVSLLAFSSPYHDPPKVMVSALSAIFGVSNFYWSACVTGVLHSCGSSDFNGVTWSLSLEWQLYAAACILICMLGNRKAIFLALFVSLALSMGPAPSFSFAWSTRSLSFVLGCVLGSLSAQHSFAMPRLVSFLILILGMALCIFSPMHASKDITLLLIGLGSALCLISTINDSLFGKHSAWTKLLVWIGDRSYSVYLLHLPCILMVREVLNFFSLLQNGFFEILVGLALSIPLIAVASHASYRHVEQRFWQTRRSPTPVPA